MINLEFHSIQMSLKTSKPSPKDRFGVTYEYSWVEPVDANNAQVYGIIQTNEGFGACIPSSWSGNVSFSSKP